MLLYRYVEGVMRLNQNFICVFTNVLHGPRALSTSLFLSSRTNVHKQQQRPIPRERVKENGGSGSGTNVAWKPAQGDLVIECILTVFVFKVRVRR